MEENKLNTVMQACSNSLNASRLALIGTTSVLALSLGGQAFAAEAEAESSEAVTPIVVSAAATIAVQSDEDDDLDELDEGDEEIVVTGSRIRRNEFSSSSPIQVLSGEISREMGIFDTADILRQSTVTAGIQPDNTMGGYVLDNGPGAATADFRGLGAGRTLLLINGRRVAPAGVGGAPVAPDLNLIPTIMVDRIEALLDGASAVYGSDAVAGVANVILRKDFDGFEIEGNFSTPEGGGGTVTSVGAMWGKTFDKGFINVAGEYYNRDTLKLKHNRITRDCTEALFEDENGNIIENGRQDLAPGTTETRCVLDTTNRMWMIGSYLGNVWSTPGTSNVGIDDWSETVLPSWGINYLGTTDWAGNPLDPNSPYYNTAFQFDDNGDGVIGGGDSVFIDVDGDGLAEIDIQNPFYNKTRSDLVREGDFLSNQERYSVYSNGEYNFEDDNNTTVYFEALYAERKGQNYTPAGAPFFPTVPMTNPTNPCMIGGPGCQSIFLSGFPAVQYFDVQPIIAIQGDRDLDKFTVNQARLVAGVRGDLPMFGDKDWQYDIYGTFSRSKGVNTLQGVHEGRLTHSLNTTVADANGNLSCPDFVDPVTGDTMACVPVNMFAPNIYQPGAGEFSPEEADYLFIDRILNTTVKQKLVSAAAFGDLFTLPWNDTTVPLVIGMDYRKDTIDSFGNEAASLGQVAFFFSDQGAGANDCAGITPGQVTSSCADSSSLFEVFAETELQLVRGKELMEELTLMASARYTNHSLYESAWTYSLKGVYRPTEWLTFRGSYGTSYRAPNLRENFLRSQTGFPTVTDPCQVPVEAREAPLQGGGAATYDPTGDYRVANGSIDRIVEACAAQGIDALSHNLQSQTQNAYSVESASGGNQQLNEETSRAFTYGIVFEQPWSDAFDLRFSATYSDIRIEDSITEPGGQNILTLCYNNAESATPGQGLFCDLIDRDPGTNNVSFIRDEFLNVALERWRGYDFNMLFQTDVEVNAKPLGISLDVRATHTRERGRELISYTDWAGDPSYPRWRGSAHLRLSYDDFAVNWTTRYIGGETLQEGLRTDFSAAPMCLASLCRPMASTEDYDVHNMSISWTPTDSIEGLRVVVGVNNVFDKMPNPVDGTDLLAVRNFPVAIGYDVYGRTYQMSIKATF